MATWLPAWLPSALPLWAWLLVLLGAWLLLLPAGIPGRSLGAVLLLPLLFSPQPRPDYAQAEVWMLDVGQGLAVLVRTQGHALLYDAGPRFGDFDTGERVVLPSIRALGVHELDLLLLSHGDNDHVGGAPAIQRGMPVRRIVSGEPGRLPGRLQAEACVSGQRWEWDGVQFSLWQWAAASDGNQASCVLRVEAAGERLLLTGDIDSHAEQALLASDMTPRAEWLLAPHHGSRGSSSQALLAQVAPHGALISRGQHNAFGHPHAEVLARYRAVSARLYDSVEQGAVRIRLGAFAPGEGLRHRARFWREK
jgi:competence protein ComEC